MVPQHSDAVVVHSQNAAVWGHWTSYVDVLGTGDNQNCPINSVQPVNCVPVLTR